PPFLAMYLAFATPWLLSFFLSREKKITRYLILFLILTLTYFSGSRSGLILVLSECLIFVALIVKARLKKKKVITALVLSPVFFFALIAYGPFIVSKLDQKISSIFVNSESDLQVSS